ncbi:MAG: polysaccharide deacetylase family protein, partial [Proteobacteria bacterium]|nr:polysaccharide deacetylase family protein [Pseudomonadota bacterium]
MTRLPALDRFPYSGLRSRPDFDWPDGKRLAVHIAINLEHFIFGEGGVDLDRSTPPPNHRSYLWRDYGNRVGVWRLLDLFDEFDLPIGVITNASIYDHCPETIAAFRARGDEIIGHGMTNSKRVSEMTEAEETEMVRLVTDTIVRHEGKPPTVWLTPYLTPSDHTPDILKEAGYGEGLCRFDHRSFHRNAARIGRDDLTPIDPLVFSAQGKHLDLRVGTRGPALDGGIAQELDEAFEAERTRPDGVLEKVCLEEPGAGVDLDAAPYKTEAARAAFGIEDVNAGDHAERVVGVGRVGRIVEGRVHAQLGFGGRV